MAASGEWGNQRQSTESRHPKGPERRQELLSNHLSNQSILNKWKDSAFLKWSWFQDISNWKYITWLTHTHTQRRPPTLKAFFLIPCSRWRIESPGMGKVRRKQPISYVMLPKHCETLIFSLSRNQHVTSKRVSGESLALQTLTEQTLSMLWNEKCSPFCFE